MDLQQPTRLTVPLNCVACEVSRGLSEGVISQLWASRLEHHQALGGIILGRSPRPVLCIYSTSTPMKLFCGQLSLRTSQPFHAILTEWGSGSLLTLNI